MTAEEQIDWLRMYNARVRFNSDQTVTVGVDNRARRRRTLEDAIVAAALAIGGTL